MALNFDIKLIPEFDGTEDNVADWISKVEMVCSLQTPGPQQENVIPLRLKGGALSVYRQLTADDKKDPTKIKSALKRAFAPDKFAAYEQFADRRLRPGESVDIFLAELEQLASLFGGMSQEGICCAFVTGLPDTVKRVLKAGARVDSLPLNELVDRARAILRESQGVVAMATDSSGAGRARWRRGATAAGVGAGRRGPCFTCAEYGHIARECPWDRRCGDGRGHSAAGGGPRLPLRPQCYRCREWGHIAAQCPNGEREGAPAPASSLDSAILPARSQ